MVCRFTLVSWSTWHLYLFLCVLQYTSNRKYRFTLLFYDNCQQEGNPWTCRSHLHDLTINVVSCIASNVGQFQIWPTLSFQLNPQHPKRKVCDLWLMTSSITQARVNMVRHLSPSLKLMKLTVQEEFGHIFFCNFCEFDLWPKLTFDPNPLQPHKKYILKFSHHSLHILVVKRLFPAHWQQAGHG